MSQENVESNGTRKFDTLLVRVTIVVVIALALLFLFKLITSNLFSTGAIEGSADGALIQANDRIIQLTQWVIATILLIGGSLVGLNWYQSERRYQNDRANDTRRITRVESENETLKIQLNRVDGERQQLEGTLWRAQRLLDYLDVANETNSADKFFAPNERGDRILSGYGNADTARRAKLAGYIAETLSREFKSILNRIIQEREKGATTLFAFERATSAIAADFPDVAKEMNAKLDQIRILVEVAPTFSDK